MRLTLIHTRFHLLQTFRIPIAVIGAAFFPAASMLFFVVPAVGGQRTGATFATASMVVFAAMTSNLFGHGIGVADDRAQPWDPYMRTLPTGPWPKFGGRILTGLVMMIVSLVPVVIIAATATAATISVARFVLAVVAVIVATLPFTLMGLAIGYLLPIKAAAASVQIAFFPLAFAGGLMSAPGQAPGFVETLAPFVPTRGAAELMWAAVAPYRVHPVAITSFVVWTVALAVLSVYAHHRDEGRRFR